MSARKSTVLFDGLCAFCMSSVAILTRLDWLHRFKYHDCRDTTTLQFKNSELDAARMLEQMHIVAPDGERVLSGYAAVRWIACRIPLLWPIVPILFLPGMTRLGQRIYLEIARRRFRLMPCHGDICTIHTRRQ